jgi:hypothetical protein
LAQRQALVVGRNHSTLKRRMSKEAFNTLKPIDIEIAQGQEQAMGWLSRFGLALTWHS